MPDRHFYLLRHHILFYITFLDFCLLAPDEIRILCGKNKGDPQKIMISQRTISPLENSSESQSLPIAPISFTIISLQFRKKISPSGDAAAVSAGRENVDPVDPADGESISPPADLPEEYENGWTVLSIAAAIFLAAVVTLAFFVLVRRKKALEKTEGKDVGRDE